MNIEPLRNVPSALPSTPSAAPNAAPEEAKEPAERVELTGLPAREEKTASRAPARKKKAGAKAAEPKAPSKTKEPAGSGTNAALPVLDADMNAHNLIHYGLAGTPRPPQEAPVEAPFAPAGFSGDIAETFIDESSLTFGQGGMYTALTDMGGEMLPLLDQTIAEGPAPVTSFNKDWRKESIYFILTDRFNDADKTNNQGVDKTDLKRYHGGDLQGVIEKLDYVKSLGMTSLWITPVMQNQKEFFDSDGYHGYWPIDFSKVDEHLGDMAKFKELVDKAHDKGLKVILDIPLNHMAWAHPYYKDPAKYDWFHHNGDIKDWNDPWQAENCNLFGLPDLAQENPAVEKYLVEAAKFWVDTGIDGFRLDAVKNVPKSFWANFDREVHKYAGDKFMLVGEYFDGDPAKLSGYQREDMTSLFDYPLYFTMKDVFTNDGSMRALAGKVDQCNREYPNSDVMSIFLDNHDTPRFLTLVQGNKEKYKLALAFMTTMNRIPTVYYGDEVGMEGSCDIMGDLSNRKDMEWNKDPEILSYFQNLMAARNGSKALQEGSLLEMWQDDQIYAYSRKADKDEALVVLNNGRDRQVRDIPLRAESALKDGTVLKDVVSGNTVTVQNHRIHVELDAKKPLILLPA